MTTVQEVTISKEDDGLRLDRWFKLHYPDLPFSKLQKLLRTGQVRLDRKRVKTNARVIEGQVLRIPPIDASQKRVPRKIKLAEETIQLAKSCVLYEDEQVLVFNKPAGIASQSGKGVKVCVDDWLEAFMDERNGKPRLVHRLDRDTSGVLLVAKTRKAASELSKVFRTRSARKIYWALTVHVPKPKQGKISGFLAKRGMPGEELMQMVSQGEEGAQHSMTHYAVVDQVAQKMAWVSLKPVTGRTHQLRVHLAALGAPILGDPKYFNIENYQRPEGVNWQLHLHARRLTIPHPVKGEIDITAPLPSHMQASWVQLGLDPKRYDADDELEDDDIQ